MQIKEFQSIIDAEPGTRFALARLVPTIRGHEKTKGQETVALLNRLSRASFDESRDARPAPATDGIDAFASEESLAAGEMPELGASPDTTDALTGARKTGAGVLIAWVAGILAVTGLAGAGIWAYQQSPAASPPGALTVQTTPPGLQVTIAGKPVGATPVTVSLPAGEYRVALAAADGRQREFAVTLAAGASVVRDIEMAPVAAPAPATGALRVETDPARQMVMVDGVERGFSPITVAELAPGEHLVVVRTQAGNLRRTIGVRQGETVSLVVSGTEAPVLRAGWVSIVSPIALELRENGRVVGTSDVERLMLPVGDHEIEMTNDALGFRATRRVTVGADRTTSVAVDVPSGMVSINALPWAEVWLGGERIGETPIANLSRPIGSYEVLLRHPQFGERRARVTISTKQTARLGVDMRTP